MAPKSIQGRKETERVPLPSTSSVPTGATTLYDGAFMDPLQTDVAYSPGNRGTSGTVPSSGSVSEAHLPPTSSTRRELFVDDVIITPLPSPNSFGQNEGKETEGNGIDNESPKAGRVTEARPVHARKQRPVAAVSRGPGFRAQLRRAKNLFVREDAKRLRGIFDRGLRRGTYDLVSSTLRMRFEDIGDDGKDNQLPGACNMFFVLPKTKEEKTPVSVRAEGAGPTCELKSVTESFTKSLVLACVERGVTAFNACRQAITTFDPRTRSHRLSIGVTSNLNAEFPGLLAWRLRTAGVETKSVARDRKLISENPLIRFFHMLEETSATTDEQNCSIDWRRLQFHLRKALDMEPMKPLRKKRKRGAEKTQNAAVRYRPDRVLEALLEGFLPRAISAAKEFLVTIRDKIHTYLFKNLAARIFLCDIYPRDPGFKITVPSWGDVSDQADDSSLLSRFNEARLRGLLVTKSYKQRDSIGNLRALPESHRDLLALVTTHQINENRDALERLMETFPEFEVVTQTRSFRYKNTSRCVWGMPEFVDVARRGEKCMESLGNGGVSYAPDVVRKLPKHYHPVTTTNLHELALDVLVQQAGIYAGEFKDCENVFLAASPDALVAVHALALTFYTALRKHVGHDLGNDEAAHRGPVSLYYDTNGSDARKGRVGLVGLRTHPLALPRTDAEGYELRSQLERAAHGLPTATFKMVRDVFFTPETKYNQEEDEGLPMLENDPNCEGFGMDEYDSGESDGSWDGEEVRGEGSHHDRNDSNDCSRDRHGGNMSGFESEQDADFLAPESL